MHLGDGALIERVPGPPRQLPASFKRGTPALPTLGGGAACRHRGTRQLPAGGYLLALDCRFSVLLAGAPVWIYRRGLTPGAAWAPQGLRFGIAVILLTIVPTCLICCCVQPLPGAMVGRQILFDGIGVVLVCMVVAWLHRGKAA